MRLLPGDLILTGTPPGVGCFRKPPEYLKVSKECSCGNSWFVTHSDSSVWSTVGIIMCTAIQCLKQETEIAVVYWSCVTGYWIVNLYFLKRINDTD